MEVKRTSSAGVRGGRVASGVVSILRIDEHVAGGDILDSDDEAPVIRWVNSLFLQAMKERASDIHIEPEEKEVLVRYRIDGELYVARRAPRAFMNSIVSRVKIESSLNIAEKRLPQDGRISKKIAGKSFDIRVSTIPTSRGYERIVMRLLNKSSVLLDLPDLGFSPRDYALMDSLIHRPDGIILVTGPTGSGKTTTLYACLNRINQPNINILTAEDPVEYELSGIHQVHVQAKIGLTFASALRAFLRQDPDVVMVGEIRDTETAQTAVEASLTGHLVLSTLHTNSAPETVTRLLDMGMDPFNFADSLLAVLAQRLVRRLCGECRTSRPATDDEVQELLADYMHAFGEGDTPQARQDTLAGWIGRHGRDGRLHMHHAPGCPNCDNTGLRGRAGVHELMVVSRAIRRLIQTGSRAEALQETALREGMRTLRQDGIEKVWQGVTTIDEVRAISNL